jgi:hypothetical protein
MKKLGFVLATLLLMCGSASAEFAKTLLEANGPATIEVVGNAANTGNTAVTVLYLAKRFDFTTGSAAPGTAFTLSDQKIASGSRLIVEIDLPAPPPGGASIAFISVHQVSGGGTFVATVSVPSSPDPSGQTFRFVFDVD